LFIQEVKHYNEKTRPSSRRKQLKSANMTEVLYVTDENDNYTTANSIGWDAKKAALEESMELIHERIEEAKQNVANNK
jgi:hypothetical protein